MLRLKNVVVFLIFCLILFNACTGSYYFTTGRILSISWSEDEKFLVFIYKSIKEYSRDATRQLDLYTVDLSSQEIRLAAENFAEVQVDQFLSPIYNLHSLPNNTFLLSTSKSGIYKLNLNGQAELLSNQNTNMFGASLSSDLKYLLINNDQFLLKDLQAKSTSDITFEDLESVQLQAHEISALQLTGAGNQLYFHTLKEPGFYTQNPQQRIVHGIAHLDFETATVKDMQILEDFIISDVKMVDNTTWLDPFLYPLPNWNRPDQLFFYQVSEKAENVYEGRLIQYNLPQKQALTVSTGEKLQEFLKLTSNNHRSSDYFYFNRLIKPSHSGKYFSYVELDLDLFIKISDLEGQNPQKILNITQNMPKSGPHIAH